MHRELWKTIGITVPHSAGASCCHKGKAIISGGRGVETMLAGTTVVDPRSGDVTTGPLMREARWKHSLLSLHSAVLAIGGGLPTDLFHSSGSWSYPGCTAAAEIWEDGAGQWDVFPIDRLPVLERAVCIPVDDDEVLVVGGTSNQGPSSQVWSVDLGTGLARHFCQLPVEMGMPILVQTSLSEWLVLECGGGPVFSLSLQSASCVSCGNLDFAMSIVRRGVGEIYALGGGVCLWSRETFVWTGESWRAGPRTVEERCWPGVVSCDLGVLLMGGDIGDEQTYEALTVGGPPAWMPVPCEATALVGPTTIVGDELVALQWERESDNTPVLVAHLPAVFGVQR